MNLPQKYYETIGGVRGSFKAYEVKGYTEF